MHDTINGLRTPAWGNCLPHMVPEEEEEEEEENTHTYMYTCILQKEG